MHAQWHGPGGVVLEYVAPTRVGDVLEGTASVIGRMAYAAGEGDEVAPSDVCRLIDWCARHTLSVCVDGEQAEGETRDLLDELLSVPALIDYAQALTTAEALPDGLVSQARAFLDVLAAGGCECPSCKDPGAPKSKRCAVAAVPHATRSLVMSWWPLRDCVSFDTPLWAYQLHQQWQDASAHAALARRDERERKTRLRNHARSRLRGMGLNA